MTTAGARGAPDWRCTWTSTARHLQAVKCRIRCRVLGVRGAADDHWARGRLRGDGQGRARRQGRLGSGALAGAFTLSGTFSQRSAPYTVRPRESHQ